jgi:hypothetical protein
LPLKPLRSIRGSVQQLIAEAQIVPPYRPPFPPRNLEAKLNVFTRTKMV